MADKGFILRLVIIAILLTAMFLIMDTDLICHCCATDINRGCPCCNIKLVAGAIITFLVVWLLLKDYPCLTEFIPCFES